MLKQITFHTKINKWRIIASSLLLMIVPTFAVHAVSASNAQATSITFLWIAIILILAKISCLIEKIGQPAVVGELLTGAILGNLALLGITWFEPIKSETIILFLAELGVVVLLFQTGLESDIKSLQKVGWNSVAVATLGVIVPFVLGAYAIGPWLFPDLNSNAYLFLGATLTATSVGISARVFQDLKRMHTREAQIVLGASITDNVLGLIIVAIVSAIATLGYVDIGTIAWITLKAFLFLILSIIAGQLIAPKLGFAFSKIHTGTGMKLTLALCFGLIFAYLAHLIGLAPIIGAFAAGLILDPTHFTSYKDPHIVTDVKKVAENLDEESRFKLDEIMKPHAERHIEDLIQPLSIILVPIFFVVTGMYVDLSIMFDLSNLFVALAFTLLAIFTKVITGFAAGQADKLVVGFGMVPRGEVGLIFAMIGRSLGVINEQIFSIIIIMVILTTLIAPLVLNYLLSRSSISKQTVS